MTSIETIKDMTTSKYSLPFIKHYDFTQKKTLEYDYEGSVWKRRSNKESDYIKHQKELLEGHAAYKNKLDMNYTKRHLTITDAHS